MPLSFHKIYISDRHIILGFVTYPFVSGSRDSNVGIVFVEDVDRSPIFALTDIRPA